MYALRLGSFESVIFWTGNHVVPLQRGFALTILYIDGCRRVDS